MTPLEAALAPRLKALGFTKKGRTWWKHSPETIGVLNLQKSPYADQIYVNLGALLKALDPNDLRPTVNRCHVSVRLESISAPDNFEQVVRATNSGPPTDRLLSAILTDGVNWLDGCSSLAGLKETVANLTIRPRGFVLATLREFIAASGA